MDPSLAPLIRGAAVVLLLGFSAFFAAAEIGFLSVGRLRAHQLAEEGVRGGVALHRLLAHPGRVLSALLVSITSLLYVGGALATDTALELGWDLWLPAVILPIITVVFAEVTPILYAAARPEPVAVWAAPGVRLVAAVLYPVVIVLGFVANLVVRIAGGTPRERQPAVTEEEIKTAITVAEEEGTLEEGEREMLHGIIESTDRTVGEVMVPLAEVVSLSERSTVREALQRVVDHRHSRLPLYRGDPTRIVGVLYAKDLLPYVRHGEMEVEVAGLRREMVEVAETRTVRSVLRELQQRRSLMGEVAREPGVTVGLVTVEDLLEEIVGDIADEHDVSGLTVEPIGEGEWLADGHVSLAEVNRAAGLHLPVEGPATLQGLLARHRAGRAAVGDAIHVADARIVVAKRKGKRVQRVRISRERESDDPATPGPDGRG